MSSQVDSPRGPGAALVPGAYNLRDLGGLPAGAGRRVRYGVLFRSEVLHRLDEAGRDAIRRLELNTVVDLRSEEEVAGQPSALTGFNAAVAHIPVFAGAAPSAAGHMTLESIYEAMVAGSGDALAEAVRAITSGTPALVHCTAGKDRTGLVTALALEAVGVEREAIVADYALSGANLEGEWMHEQLARMEAAGVVLNDSTLGVLATSPPELLRDLLTDLDARFGEARGYLSAHGVTAEELEALQKALIEDI